MDLLDFLSTDRGLKLLALIGAGIVVLGAGIWKVVQHFKSDVSADDSSIASGRDTNININDDENRSRKR